LETERISPLLSLFELVYKNNSGHLGHICTSALRILIAVSTQKANKNPNPFELQAQNAHLKAIVTTNKPARQRASEQLAKRVVLGVPNL
jgi:hypothetical protein